MVTSSERSLRGAAVVEDFAGEVGSIREQFGDLPMLPVILDRWPIRVGSDPTCAEVSRADLGQSYPTLRPADGGSTPCDIQRPDRQILLHPVAHCPCEDGHSCPGSGCAAPGYGPAPSCPLADRSGPPRTIAPGADLQHPADRLYPPHVTPALHESELHER